MRPLNVQIRLGNLRHNYQILKEMHGGKLLAVVKADAYGHGAVRCAFALADLADGFAVATIDEGIRLRESGITHPIVLLEAYLKHQSTKRSNNTRFGKQSETNGSLRLC